jgi:hypothetical protein
MNNKLTPFVFMSTVMYDVLYSGGHSWNIKLLSGIIWMYYGNYGQKFFTPTSKIWL